MKVIDILQKIANGEEVPEKIKINNVIYEYRGYMYCTEKANYQDIEDYLFGKWNFNILNEEVEIIEEDKPKVIVEDTEGNKKKYVIDLSECLVDGERIFKKDNKWYVQKIINEDSEFSQWLKQFEPTIYTIEEEKEIPEKINVISWDKCIHNVTHKEKELAIEINKTQELLNQVIDYLKSKGE